MQPIIFPMFLTMAITVAGCSIKDDVPEFKYPSQTDFTDQDWPKLVVTEELRATGLETQRIADQEKQAVERLAARARALRLRANRLKNQSYF